MAHGSGWKSRAETSCNKKQEAKVLDANIAGLTVPLSSISSWLSLRVSVKVAIRLNELLVLQVSHYLNADRLNVHEHHVASRSVPGII